MDGRLAELAAGAWVAYTGVYVTDDFFRVRPGRPRPCGRLARQRVASGRAAGHRDRPWFSGAHVRLSTSAPEAPVRLPVVEQVADAVHAVLEDRGGGEDHRAPTAGSTNEMTFSARKNGGLGDAGW